MRILQALFGLILIAFVLLLGTLALFAVWSLLTTASPQIASSVIIASATILVSVLSVLFSKRQEQRREIEQEQRKQKAAIYQEFMAFWFQVLGSSKGNKGPTAEDINKFFKDFTQKVIVWGSEPFLQEYSDFRRGYGTGPDKSGQTNVEALLGFERMLFAMRADIGYSNKGLKSGDLLSLFVTDIDEQLENWQRAQNGQ